MNTRDNTFRWHNRLHSPKEFQRVFDHNQLKAGSKCLLVLAASNEQEYPRLGLVISKKKLPRAHDRNRVKRLVRESFRHHKHVLAGLDILVIARDGLRTADNPLVTKELEKLWSRLLAAKQ